MLFYNYHIDFLKELIPHYHLSKRFYLERELTYNSITTILRQICKSHELQIISKMKYSDSNYIIEYSIPKIPLSEYNGEKYDINSKNENNEYINNINTQL